MGMVERVFKIRTSLRFFVMVSIAGRQRPYHGQKKPPCLKIRHGGRIV